MNQLKAVIITLFLSNALFVSNVTAREQYQMTQPPGPPPSGPLGGSALSSSGGYRGGGSGQIMGAVPGVGADFWTNALSNQVPVGTVLSGVLQEDLSSKTSKTGDIFTILLTQGTYNAGKEVIPAGSRILGQVVTATPAPNLKYGMPGSLDVNLSVLIFPDGRNLRFNGFIDRNSNQDLTQAPKVKQHGYSIKEYGQTLAGMFAGFTSGLAPQLNRRNKGQEFSMTKGTVLPIRLTRAFMVPPATVADGNALSSGASSISPGFGVAPNAMPLAAPTY